MADGAGRYRPGQVRGLPVLFIPGNAGSGKQMRSLASQAAAAGLPLDVWGVDFEEEFSGMSGTALLAQAGT